MITLNVTGNKDNGVVRAFLGLSKDTKPIRWFQDSMIPNGSTYYEIDTARTYMYSFEDEKWYFQPSASPGGGDGVTIEGITVDDDNHLIFSYSNGTTQDAGEITISKVATTCLYTPDGDTCIFGTGGGAAI